MALRIDAGSLRPARRLADGRLRVDAHLTRTGVFAYRQPDGSVRREYRPDAEVFAPESLESFELTPVTDDHPPSLLTTDNAQQYTRGSVGNGVRRDGSHVAAPLAVFDALLAEKMERGKVHVSCGYTCDLDETPGMTPDGERYDAIQRNIRGNHVAIVDVGRAGTALVRMDGAAEMITTDARKDHDMDELEKLKAALAEANARAAAANARADRSEGERDAAQAAATRAEQARADAQAGYVEQVRKRVTLEAQAKTHNVPVTDKMTDRDVKVAIIKRLDGADIPATATDGYVDGRFDAALESASRADAAVDAARTAATGEPHADGDDDPEAAARARMVNTNRNRWTTTQAAPEGVN